MQVRLIEIRSLDHAAPDTLFERAKEGAFDGVFNADPLDRDALAAWGGACASRGLAFWLVVVPDVNGDPVTGPRPHGHVDPWLAVGRDALDPRRAAGGLRADPVDPSPAQRDAWLAMFRDAVAGGASAFIVRDVDRCPVAFWRETIARLRETHAGVRLHAWTAGLAPDAIDALVDAGFDGVGASLAWWDGRSRWLVDELRAHPGTSRLVFPADPFADAPDRTPVDASLARLRMRMRLAALIGDVVLMPDWCATLLPAPALASRMDDAMTPALFELLSGPDSPTTALVTADAPDLRAARRIRLALFHLDSQPVACCDVSVWTERLGAFGRFRAVPVDEAGEVVASDSASSLDARSTLTLAPGEFLLFDGERLDPVVLPVPAAKRSALAALDSPRLAIEDVTPSVEGGRFPVKRIAGESVRVEADLIIDGHEMLAAALLYRVAGERSWREVAMQPIGNDRYAASFPLSRIGRHEFTIETWRDAFAHYRYEIDKKWAAGLDVSLELAEGRILVDAALARARQSRRGDLGRRLAALAKALEPKPRAADASADGSASASALTATVPKLDRTTMATQVAALLASQTADDMRAADERAFAYRAPVVWPVDAERIEARFASWYELFPRSAGNRIGEPLRHGTFDDVIERLPAVRDMGFDVLYFTPVHPIGRRNRKGRNNSLTATDDDPGSPYAIGSADGGHDALHPELGTFDDFKRLRDAALAHGLELALDFAIQCSPDHPWLKAHPGWFAWRPDGSLRYAENPPKKYEDIVNVDFYAEGSDRNDAAALWIALRDVILLWVGHGVKIFRVDNPHTKALPFWEWMIGEVRARHPDTIFLSEAFTRPKVMYRLAKVGFSQSYTYFTWRHTKQEFIDYMTQLTAPSIASEFSAAPRDFFRPNFFVNTPDINPYFLQRSGRAGFLIRAALAATLSGLWGVYSGFELCEATPVPGREDYLDSEKYEIRAWDWQRPGHIIAEITALNRLRRENPALQTHLNVVFENAFDPNILYFMKATEDRSNVLLVAINLDPFGVHEADFEVPLWRWGLPDDAAVDVTDCLDGHRFRWAGKVQRMRLDPQVNPYAIWRVAL